jgi:hypothetical protein
MGFGSWYKGQSEPIKVAVASGIVVGIFGLLTGVVAGVFSIANTELGKESSKSTATPITVTTITTPVTVPPVTTSAVTKPVTTPTTPPKTASPSCLHELRITQPSEDAIIPRGRNGVIIKGTACGLGSYSGWLFELDSDDHYYWDIYSASTPASAIQSGQDGNWQFPDSPIGGSGDQNKLYTITLVLAPPSCDKALRSAKPIDGDYKLRSFPSGCKIADRVDIYVTY